MVTYVDVNFNLYEPESSFLTDQEILATVVMLQSKMLLKMKSSLNKMERKLSGNCHYSVLQMPLI